MTHFPADSIQSFKFYDSGSFMQFSCKYNGDPAEAVGAFGGFFSLLLWLASITYFLLSSTSRFNKINITEIDWGGVAKLGLIGLVVLILLFSFGIECLWQIFGKEIITFSNNGITLRHQIFGIGLSRRFYISEINGVFVTQVRNTNKFIRTRSYGFLNFKHGKVAFNSGKSWLFREPNSFRFGTDLSWDEAKQIVAKIHQRFPKYQYDWWSEKN